MKHNIAWNNYFTSIEISEFVHFDLIDMSNIRFWGPSTDPFCTEFQGVPPMMLTKIFARGP